MSEVSVSAVWATPNATYTKKALSRIVKSPEASERDGVVQTNEPSNVKYSETESEHSV